MDYKRFFLQGIFCFLRVHDLEPMPEGYEAIGDKVCLNCGKIVEKKLHLKKVITRHEKAIQKTNWLYRQKLLPKRAIKKTGHLSDEP